MGNNEPGISIMVLESDSIVAGDLRKSLEGVGYQVTTLNDTETGFLWAEKKRPQLVVTDVSLKEKWDGITIARRIWHELMIPVVYLSANTDRETVEQSLQTLPFGFLIKPFDDLELRMAIELALNQFKYIKEISAANRELQHRADKLLQETTVQETAASGHDELPELVTDGDGSAFLEPGPGEEPEQPEELTTALKRCRSSPTAALIVWGEEHLLFYNDPCREILAGFGHPSVMGAPAEVWWPELWNILQPLVDRVLSEGCELSSGDLYLPVTGAAGTIESRLSLLCTPIRDGKGRICGVYCRSHQHTETVLGRRRFKTIYRLATTLQSKDGDFAARAAQALGTNLRDIPFSLLYRRQGNSATLIASSGIDQNSAVAPPTVKLKQNRYLPWAYPFLKAAANAAPELVDNLAAGFPELVCGVGESPHSALVLPLHDRERVSGFLVLGLSPRLSYDQDYRLFGETLAEMISAGLFPADRHHGETGVQVAEQALGGVEPLSEERCQLLADTVPDILFITLTDGTFNYVNRRFSEYTGLTANDILGQGWQQILCPQDQEIFDEKWRQATLSGEPFEEELRLKNRHGDYHWFMVRSHQIGISPGQTTWFGTCTDIDEIKKRNSDLRASLEQKETILKEVHHRVKNNMQLISSLLRLQFGSSQDQKVSEALRQSQNRIRSISLVHEKLYGTKDLNNVDLRDYLSDLADSLYRSMEVDRGRISLKIGSVEKVSLKMDLAIPCGLIVTELLSNSLKHAFSERRRGEIEIIIRPADAGWLELIHRDDGVGLPEGVDPLQATSLGLQLVATLATKQLNGELDLARGQGSEFRIRFPIATERGQR